MFSTAAHITPFLLMEIIVQQSIVYVRAGILKTIMLVSCLHANWILFLRGL